MKIRLVILGLMIIGAQIEAGAWVSKVAALKQGVKNLSNAMRQKVPYLRSQEAQKKIKVFEGLIDYSKFKAAHVNGTALLENELSLNERMNKMTPSPTFAYGKYTRFASEQLLSNQKYLLEEAICKILLLWERQYKDAHLLLHTEKLLQEALVENAKNFDLLNKIQSNVHVLEKHQRLTMFAAQVGLFGTLGAAMYAVGTGAAAGLYYGYSYLKDALPFNKKIDQKVSIYDNHDKNK